MLCVVFCVNASLAVPGFSILRLAIVVLALDLFAVLMLDGVVDGLVFAELIQSAGLEGV